MVHLKFQIGKQKIGFLADNAVPAQVKTIGMIIALVCMLEHESQGRGGGGGGGVPSSFLVQEKAFKGPAFLAAVCHKLSRCHLH